MNPKTCIKNFKNDSLLTNIYNIYFKNLCCRYFLTVFTQQLLKMCQTSMNFKFKDFRLYSNAV